MPRADTAKPDDAEPHGLHVEHATARPGTGKRMVKHISFEARRRRGLSGTPRRPGSSASTPQAPASGSMCYTLTPSNAGRTLPLWSIFQQFSSRKGSVLQVNPGLQGNTCVV